ncbi:hypothetical protein RFI_08986 [Reticulomyxa filosa]|uniref:Uncharacterized protein n=1 Tax=Reticulomyxa filosa TaxID=46433 RepID=X6NS28_RETFI|nr:hypothetical protein RFI_08986 [Reticulomyxa filosa]|eukprot:ETO28147.1 hypothetical protein RFI_08986 [Reticulomyxa filosa]
MEDLEKLSRQELVEKFLKERERLTNCQTELANAQIKIIQLEGNLRTVRREWKALSKNYKQSGSFSPNIAINNVTSNDNETTPPTSNV